MSLSIVSTSTRPLALLGDFLVSAAGAGSLRRPHPAKASQFTTASGSQPCFCNHGYQTNLNRGGNRKGCLRCSPKLEHRPSALTFWFHRYSRAAEHAQKSAGEMTGLNIFVGEEGVKKATPLLFVKMWNTTRMTWHSPRRARHV